MSYEQRPNRPHTDTTRHLRPDEARDTPPGTPGYFNGARRRATRFAETTDHLRDLHREIDALGQEVQGRPTGVLSGGDVDIAYYYLAVGFGVLATLYSVIGSIFAFQGGGTTFLSSISQRWAAGPAPALMDAALNARTLSAVGLQIVLFVVLVGTRRNPRSWQHWAA